MVLMLELYQNFQEEIALFQKRQCMNGERVLQTVLNGRNNLERALHGLLSVE